VGMDASWVVRASRIVMAGGSGALRGPGSWPRAAKSRSASGKKIGERMKNDPAW
jgi:hypothetical protein